jgi:hypothetical protein
MKMDEQTLKAILKAHIASAEGSHLAAGTSLSDQRQKALEYYRGEPFGNEVEGRSSIVSRDVADTVEWMLPSLLEIFTAGDDVVRFDPVGSEDERMAKQATEYCNHIFTKENDGFQVLYDTFKDALLQKMGIAKVCWEYREHKTVKRYKGLTAEELAKLEQDESLELDEVTEREEEIAMPDPQTGQLIPQMVPVMDARFIHTEKRGGVRVDSVPPEEFMFSRRAVKLEDEAGHMIVPFVCHRVKKTLSDLVAEGYDKKLLADIPSSDDGEYNQERTERFDDADLEGIEVDKSMRTIWLHECYLRVDMDGDGIAETRKVLVGGNGHTILDNEEIDEQPFTVITPVPMPHTLVGDSIADQVMDVQELKSTIWRQLLDNIYNVNNTRNAVSNKVDLDSLLNNAVGGAIVVDTEQNDVSGHIVPQVTPSIAGHIFPMLEYADQVKESRAGVSRLNQGVDPDALNNTASGTAMLMSASQRRIMLIARVFAQTGVRDMFRKILRMSVKYQDKPKMIRLRNQLVEVDPASWNAQMDVTVNVGLGYGNREQQLVARRQILDLQKSAVELQGGVNGPIIYADHISHAFKKFIEAAGEQQPDAYVMDVDPEQARQPPPEPGPDPEMQKLQMDMQTKQAEMQMKGQLEQQKAQVGVQAKQAELQMKAQAEERKAQLEIQKMQLEYKKLEMEQAAAANEMAMKREEHQQEMAMDREKFTQEMALKRQEAEFNARLRASESQQKAGLAAQAANKPAETPKEAPMPNITILNGNKRRRVNLERDGEGSIMGAVVEDDD